MVEQISESFTGWYTMPHTVVQEKVTGRFKELGYDSASAKHAALKLLATAAIRDALAERPLDWSVSFGGVDNGVSRLGVCKFKRAGVRILSAKISISAAYVDALPIADPAILETILHEVAHAIAGPEAGHGSVWARECLRLGIPAKRCGDVPDEIQAEMGRVRIVCVKCDSTVAWRTRPEKLLESSRYSSRCCSAKLAVGV